MKGPGEIYKRWRCEVCGEYVEVGGGEVTVGGQMGLETTEVSLCLSNELKDDISQDASLYLGTVCKRHCKSHFCIIKIP